MGKSTFLRYVWAGLLALFFASGAMAADEMSPSELLKQAIRYSEAGKYDEAIITMYDYIDIVRPSQANRVIAIAQDIRFKLSRLLIEQNRLDEAADVLKEYISLPLCKYPRQANRMLATCYYETDKFKECVTAVTNALEYNENPVVVVKAKADEAADDGVLEVEKEVDDPEYTQNELVMLHLTLGESFFELENWAESIDPFTFVIEKTTDEQRKGYAIMQVVNALINMEDFGRILQWIPQLYRTDARYDIRVNLALLNAAAALYKAEEYDSALPLYRMILPRDEVVAFQEERLRVMRVEAGLTPADDVEIPANELLLFGGDEEEEAAEEAETEVEPPKEVRELEELIAALKNLPPYENNVAYRIGQIYRSVDRYWEAVEYFDSVYGKDATGDLGERAIADVIEVLLENLAEIEEAQTRGFEYLAEHTNGLAPRQIAYTFTGYFQENKQMDSVTNLFPYLEGFGQTNDSDIVRYDIELYFMQAVANLMLFKYEESEKGFKLLLDKYPDSHQQANAQYWYSMSKLFQQNYPDALAAFDTYIADFPEGDWVDESYYQGGICMFGLEQYSNAMERFSLIIDNYPNSSVYPNACSMRGDLYGAEGGEKLDLAIKDYHKALDSAKTLKNVRQATYATFQMAQVLEADAEAMETEEKTQAKYDELIRVVESYRDTWGAEADIAKALFWIGKIKIVQGKVEEAVESYVDAIVRFGGDLQQDGVDMMVAELVRVSQIWLGVEQQNQLMEDLQAALDNTDNEVLSLRLRVTMAKMDYAEIELGKRLIKELPNLDSASPPVLAVICDASFEMEDYSRAKELLNIFLNKYEESDYIRAAYKLRAFGQFEDKEYDEALMTIDEAQGQYGHDRDVVWAQLMKAQILLEQGKYDEAREANMYVRQEPKWRGEPVAQATYQLGQVEEKAGNLEKAFGFYQRTYIQFKGHAGGHWAAEAYLASARVLGELGQDEKQRMTYEAFLLDKYVNELPQADVARKALGAGEVAEIETLLSAGVKTNIIIQLEIEGGMTAEGTESTDTTSDSPPADTTTESSPAEPSETVSDAAGTEGE